MLKKSIEAIKERYLHSCQKVGACIKAPSRAHVQLMLFGVGVVMLSTGLIDSVLAQTGADEGGGIDEYNAEGIREATCIVFRYLEGSFGALVMVASGIGAILSAAFGQYRAALGLMVVAIGSFIIRSITSTFFGAENTNCNF